jgi:hypothetical protein
MAANILQNILINWGMGTYCSIISLGLAKFMKNVGFSEAKSIPNNALPQWKVMGMNARI